MQGISSGTAGLLAALLLFLAAMPVAAEMDSDQLKLFRQEAEAFNRQDPFANAYRAGHYNGYVAGILDALQGRSVCFRECICELDKMVERQLADHPEMNDRPVVEWLVPLMEKQFPCK
ncbi:MAG: hypothetical protein FIA96_11050 [Betaproteobacteria bacterium]|jgi:hypothetical protein|nr:hypothetical protein [Betaproteobacteria bacterium]